MFSFVLDWGRIQDTYPLLDVNFGQFRMHYPLLRSFVDVFAALRCLIRFAVAASALNVIFVFIVLKLLILDLSSGIESIIHTSRTHIDLGQFQVHCLLSPHAHLMKSFTEVFDVLVSLIDSVLVAFVMDVMFVLVILKLIMDFSLGILSIIIKSTGLLRREHFSLALRCLSL